MNNQYFTTLTIYIIYIIVYTMISFNAHLNCTTHSTHNIPNTKKILIHWIWAMSYRVWKIYERLGYVQLSSAVPVPHSKCANVWNWTEVLKMRIVISIYTKLEWIIYPPCINVSMYIFNIHLFGFNLM